MWTRTGFRVRDIGPDLTWIELRDFIEHLPPSGDSALYRAQHPESWWWTPIMDFLAAIILTLRHGNWQRGGGRGPKPEPVKRPKEKPRVLAKTDPVSADDLASRRASLKEKLKGGD